MSTIGTVVVLPLQPHPADCPVCEGDGRVRVSRVRRRLGGEVELPAWPVAQLRPCPWPFGADDLAAWLGLSGSAPDGPEGAA